MLFAIFWTKICQAIAKLTLWPMDDNQVIQMQTFFEGKSQFRKNYSKESDTSENKIIF